MLAGLCSFQRPRENFLQYLLEFVGAAHIPALMASSPPEPVMEAEPVSGCRCSGSDFSPPLFTFEDPVITLDSPGQCRWISPP